MTVLLRRAAVGDPGVIVLSCGTRRSDREVGREDRTLTGCALDREPATVAVDDVFDDGEAQAGALPFAAFLTLDAIEALGEPRQMLARHARPVVADDQSGIAQPRLTIRGDEGQARGAALARAAGPGGG